MSLRTSSVESIVFGSTGVVGQAIVNLLCKKAAGSGKSEPFITAVSRSGSIPALEHLTEVRCKAGDAKDEKRTIELCQGVQVIYCCIGLPYNSAMWEDEYPVIVESMLKAAEASGAVLVWVDNLYMFGPEAAESGIPMKESHQEFTEYGRKPALRSRLDKMMLDAAAKGRCKVAIVRASDFYGPGVRTSAVGDQFFPNVMKGRTVYLFGNPNVRHTYTYVPDLARAAIAIACGGENAWGRAWHCPNAPALPTADFLQLTNKFVGNEKLPRFAVLKGLKRAFLALFVPALREIREMSFVWDKDYIVDHADFSERFPDVVPTPMEQGIKETIEWWRAQGES